MSARKSLRGAINAHCKSCIYDREAAGTWLAQVTLCSVHKCELWDVRPTTDTIPESVIEYYGVSRSELSRLRLKSGLYGGISDQTGSVESRTKGAT